MSKSRSSPRRSVHPGEPASKSQSSPRPPPDLPQDQIAADFMTRKGYRNIQYRQVVRIEGLYCWYYDYDLPDGVLELEVTWTPEDDWQAQVSVFRPEP